MAEAVDCTWATDQRGLPPFNFVQLPCMIYNEQNTITLQFARQDGVPKVKFGHKYYHQDQGQMYVSNLERVDYYGAFLGSISLTTRSILLVMI